MQSVWPARFPLALSHQHFLSPAQVVVPTRVGQLYVYDSPKEEQGEYDVPRHLQEIYDVPPTRALLSNQSSQEVRSTLVRAQGTVWMARARIGLD